MVPVRISCDLPSSGAATTIFVTLLPPIEWNWGDGTVSESSAGLRTRTSRGVSQIRRRYTVLAHLQTIRRVSDFVRLKPKNGVINVTNDHGRLLGGGFLGLRTNIPFVITIRAHVFFITTQSHR